jgi:hypothetical protein
MDFLRESNRRVARSLAALIRTLERSRAAKIRRRDKDAHHGDAFLRYLRGQLREFEREC